MIRKLSVVTAVAGSVSTRAAPTAVMNVDLRDIAPSPSSPVTLAAT